MEEVQFKLDISAASHFSDALSIFFKDNTPDAVKVLCWKFFQCWVTRDCKLQSDLSDEEIASFFDQLNSLVAAAYIVHQANGALATGQEGSAHE